MLAEQFRVITFDNRGSGRSDAPKGPYTLAQLAGDVESVLDAADEESAHVYRLLCARGDDGAQEFALTRPSRVRRLVLGATTPRRTEKHELPDENTLGFVERRAGMPAEEGAWASVPYNYGPTTRAQHARIASGEDILQRLRFPPSKEGYKAQLSAAWDSTPSTALQD